MINGRDKEIEDLKLKVIYKFPPKDDRHTVSCVVEVSPSTRNHLLKDKNIYIKYSACRINDYIRVLQCYKCLAFGHYAKDCKAMALCGHCAGEHELRSCPSRNKNAICGNCKRWPCKEGCFHSALDGSKCPILRRKIMDKAKYINYG